MNKFISLSEHEIHLEVKKIVADSFIRIRHVDSDLCFINKEQLEILKLLKISALKLQQKGLIKKQKVDFFSFAKILNLDYPVVQYELFLKHKYKNVSDLKKSTRYKQKIQKEYHIEIAETEEYYKELFKNYGHEFSNEKIESINREKEDKLKMFSEYKDELINYSSRNIVKSSSFDEKILRPHIKFIDAISIEKIDYLRKDVPNFLYAHKNISKIEPGYRKNAKHIEFILSSTHAFGDIYFKPIEETIDDKN